MTLYDDWNEPIYRDIAKASGSKQAVADVKYARKLFALNDLKKLHLRLDKSAMLLAEMSSRSLRIICVAVDEAQKKKGLGGGLLKYAESIAIANGCERIFTVTTSGVEFYKRNGYYITGKRKNGWELTKRIK